MNNQEKFLVIGGTEKAGTTSLYEYFCKHPELNSSFKKETDYLRGTDISKDGYIRCFEKNKNFDNYFEASPGYLTKYHDVIANLNKIEIDIRFIFILRDPIERLISSFKFHKSKLYIPEDLDINDYIQMCLDYEKGSLSLADSIFNNDWFLQVLSAGRYDKAIESFQNNGLRFRAYDFSQLKDNMSSVVSEICDFFEIDSSVYENYDFHTANQTFTVKNRRIHSIGIFVNNKLEMFFRRNPEIKQYLLKLYKGFNSKPGEAITINNHNLDRLKEYYSKTYIYCKNLLEEKEFRTMNWRHFDEK